MLNFCCAAKSRRYGRVSAVMAGAMLAALAVAPAAAAATELPQSWDGMKWARTGILDIQLGNNVSSVWEPYVTKAAGEWSAARNINYVAVDGTTDAAFCDPVWGTVQMCSGNYGRTGWLGYTSVWTYGDDGNLILGGTIQLNEYYYSQSKYNTAAWRASTVCQELGNALGLADSDHNFGNANTGSCMDYTKNPAATSKSLANTDPNASDMAHLDAIYATTNGTQLAETMPGAKLAGYAMFGSANLAVPEPATWAMLLVGFGAVGRALRRREAVVAG